MSEKKIISDNELTKVNGGTAHAAQEFLDAWNSSSAHAQGLTEHEMDELEDRWNASGRTVSASAFIQANIG